MNECLQKNVFLLYNVKHSFTFVVYVINFALDVYTGGSVEVNGGSRIFRGQMSH